jgi:hypothetical protein
MARAMIRMGVVADVDEAFDRYLEQRPAAYVDKIPHPPTTRPGADWRAGRRGGVSPSSSCPAARARR